MNQSLSSRTSRPLLSSRGTKCTLRTWVTTCLSQRGLVRSSSPYARSRKSGRSTTMSASPTWW